MNDINFKLISEALEQVIKEKTKREKDLRKDIEFLIEHTEKHKMTDLVRDRLEKIKQGMNWRI